MMMIACLVVEEVLPAWAGVPAWVFVIPFLIVMSVVAVYVFCGNTCLRGWGDEPYEVEEHQKLAQEKIDLFHHVWDEEEDWDRGCAIMTADKPAASLPSVSGQNGTSQEGEASGGTSRAPAVAVAPVQESPRGGEVATRQAHNLENTGSTPVPATTSQQVVVTPIREPAYPLQELVSPSPHGLTSYPKVFSIGHKAVKQLFEEPVLIEEKVDGSIFSFGVGLDGVLRCRSKKKEVSIEAPDKMFALAVQTAKELAPDLHRGWTYRCEYLRKPKHNTLAYDRVPRKHLVLFDVDTGLEAYLNRDKKKLEAAFLGLEVVPWLFWGRVKSMDEVLALLNEQSFLGGQKVEGIVVKNYARFGPDGKALMGKYVSEEFKEVHRKSWKDRNPGGRDILQRLVNGLKTEARWNKAVQHLRDRGELLGSPHDIGPLIAEVKSDTMEEVADMMRDQLYEWARDTVARGVAAGLAEWYKKKLLEGQFSEGGKDEHAS